MLGGNGMADIGVPDDSTMRFDVGSYLGGVLPMIFGPKNWGADSPSGRVKAIWSGAMGWSADGFPFVGRLDPALTGRKPPQANNGHGVAFGEWISAGYCGEGMPQAWLCGVACALMVLEREDVEVQDVAGRPEGKLMEWFPAEMVVSPKRVRRANVYELANEL